MSTYAVLGATGNTGLSLLRILSVKVPQPHINAYCRSKSKLFRLDSSLASNPSLTVYEGNLEDTALIASCIRGTHAVFLAVAQPSNKPDCTIAQDTARVVVAALQTIKDGDPAVKMPRLVVLMSSELDTHLSRKIPAPVRYMLERAVSWVYADLRVARKFLLEQESWLSVTFVMPGALSDDVQRGHVLSLDIAESPVSFMDLAAGMVEIADSDGDVYDMKNVAVNPTSNEVRFPWVNVKLLFVGLLIHFFPVLYPYIG